MSGCWGKIVVVGGGGTQKNRVTQSPFDFGLWTWIVTILSTCFTPDIFQKQCWLLERCWCSDLHVHRTLQTDEEQQPEKFIRCCSRILKYLLTTGRKYPRARGLTSRLHTAKRNWIEYEILENFIFYQETWRLPNTEMRVTCWRYWSDLTYNF